MAIEFFFKHVAINIILFVNGGDTEGKTNEETSGMMASRSL